MPFHNPWNFEWGWRMAIEHLDQLSPIRIAMTILAVYRLALLFSRDDGLLFVFRRIRLYADKNAKIEQDKLRERFEDGEFEDEERILLGPRSNFYEGIFCPMCVGLYMSALCIALLFLPTIPGDIFLGIFGLAGGQTFLQKWRE